MSTNPTLKEIEQDLHSLSLDVHNDKVVSDNSQYLQNLAKNNIPTLLIKEILNDDQLLEEVASRSYEHVNHFDKIVLIDNPDPKGYRLTIHSWNCNYGKEVPDEELIHNHRFSFWSHIFRGNLTSENFLESKDFSIEKKTFNRYVYRPSNTGNIHDCDFDKKAQLNKIETVTHRQGDVYYLNYNITHRILLPKEGENLCTFVIRGPREREYTNTYNTFYPERGKSSNVPMMTKEELREKLIKILEN